MKFKIIQKGELKRLRMMLESRDSEQRELALDLLCEAKFVRFSPLTLVALVCFGLLFTLTGGIALLVYTSLSGWFIIPLIVGFILQIILSIGYIEEMKQRGYKHSKIISMLTD